MAALKKIMQTDVKQVADQDIDKALKFNISSLAQYKPTINKSLKTPIGYTSDLAIFLKNKFGLDIVFHGKEGMPPHGYTIVDHVNKNVFNGGEIMPLKELIQKNKAETNNTSKIIADRLDIKVDDLHLKQEEAQIRNESSLEITAKEKDVDIRDHIKGDQNITIEPTQYRQEETYIESTVQSFELSISDDIDDEQINGSNRRREKKSRVNTR